MSNLFWLDQIRPSQRLLVGNKAFSLSCLLQRGHAVVPGFVVSAQSLRDFLGAIDWTEPLFADLPHSDLHLDIENSRQLRTIAQQIRHGMAAAPLSSKLQKELLAAVSRLQASTVILRPSLFVQTTPEIPGLVSHNAIADFKSSALFNSQLCKTTEADLATGLKQLWAELFGARSLFYWQRLGILLQQVHLAVLVQPMRAAIASGTVRVEQGSFHIRSTPGLGMAIAWGDGVPDTYEIDAGSGAVRTQHLGTKTMAYALAQTDFSVQASQAGWQASPASATLQGPEASALEVNTLEASALEANTIAALTHPPLEKITSAVGTPFQPLTQSLLPASALLHAYFLDLEQQQRHTLDNATLQALIQLVQTVVAELGTSLELEWILCPGENASPKLYLTQVSSWLPMGPSEQADSPPELFQAETRSGIPSERTPPDSTATIPAVDKSGSDRPLPQTNSALIITGLGASPGQTIAKASVIRNLQAVTEAIPPGTVLVVPTILPDWLPQIQQAAAIVSEQGGMTCHGAIVAREMGVPAVMAATQATEKIQHGELVMVDGNTGRVYRLVPNTPAPTPATAISWDRPDQANPHPTGALSSLPPIGTRLMVNLSQPASLARVSALPIDGIGLLRSELLAIAIFDYQHPNFWLQQGRKTEFVARLASQIGQFAQALLPRPVFYRSLDLRSHEFRRLTGGDTIPAETNPMLGLRGTLSYQVDSTLFDLELAALAQVQQAGYPNVHLLLPFVRTVEEFRFCRQRVEQAGLLNHSQCQLWIMAEVPSVLFLLPEYVRAGVQGISIGTNDLTQLLLGVDRDQGQMATVFDERHPAVLAAVAQLVQQARQAGIPCSICGQAPAQYPEVIDHLVRWGITSISVEPEAVEQTYWAIARAERRLLLDTARGQG